MDGCIPGWEERTAATAPTRAGGTAGPSISTDLIWDGWMDGWDMNMGFSLDFVAFCFSLYEMFCILLFFFSLSFLYAAFPLRLLFSECPLPR
jgi:hypothetical protein